jgi:predicted PurR-regulated permease PerM
MVINKLKKLAQQALNKIEEATSEVNDDNNKKKLTLPETSDTNNQVRFVQVSIQDVIKITLVLMGLGLAATLLISIRDIAFILLLSYLFAAALVPSVKRLKEYNIPEGLSVIIIYILIISILSILVGNLIPILSYELVDLAFQAQNLINDLSTNGIQVPSFLKFFQPIVDNTLSNVTSNEITSTVQKNLLTVGGNLGTLAGNAIDLIVVISNGLANALLIMVLSYFITVDQEAIDKFIISLFPKKYQNYIENRSGRINPK